MEKRGLTGMGIWNTKDYKGQPVTWYSAEEIEKYKKILEEVKEILTNKAQKASHACNESCENAKEPREYHLLCRIYRALNEITKGVK